jgi:hypothetical protein
MYSHRHSFNRLLALLSKDNNLCSQPAADLIKNCNLLIPNPKVYTMNEDYSYYLDTKYPEDERRDAAFQTVNALRESLTLARNGSVPVSYEFAFDIIFDLNPKLYDALITLLVSKNENELVKYYKEEAEASSTDDDIVLPLDLIDKEIERVTELISQKSGKNVYLKKKKFELTAAKEYYTPRVQSEHKSLSHDFYLTSREASLGKPLYDNDHYKDYKVGKDKVLRLRLLHPDKDEAVLGVDLIYEHFDLKQSRVRFAHMQYKSWNSKVLYSSATSNMVEQLTKMQQHLCSAGLCAAPPDNTRDTYRFPYCSGFLRPTSKIQNPESKLITTGLHLPICQALNLFKTDGKVTTETCKDRSIKGNIFEDLFISGLAGSRWISIDSLEDFYASKSITSNLTRIRIHAQEVDILTDFEANKNR